MKPLHWGSGDRPEPSWKSIDSEGLQELPSYLCGSDSNVFSEWTYTVDLDRQVFGINNWIWFRLDKIPRDSWILGFEYNEDGDSEFSFEECPEASDLLKSNLMFFTDEEQNACHEKYGEYSCLSLEVSPNVGSESIILPGEILGLMNSATRAAISIKTVGTTTPLTI